MPNTEPFNHAVVNMSAASSPYSKEYMFYLHVLSQCKIVFDDNLRAPAGVAFRNDHYVLYINTKDVIYEGYNKKGEKVTVNGISNSMPLVQRLGVIKHEMLHIIFEHVGRKEDRDHEGFNYAADCALNQDIKRDHLPKGVIYPDNLPTKVKDVLLNQTAEYYYDILDKDYFNPPESGSGDSDGDSGGEKSSSGGGEKLVDADGNEVGVHTHEKWEESVGDSQIRKEITKKMVEKAAEETTKSLGNLPANYSKMIDNLTVSREVCWKKVLRGIIGNKKVGTRKTFMRKNRRQPNFNWLKGTTKKRTFDLGVISDVSGSVDDKQQVSLWSSIIGICHDFNTPVNMIQVDTEPSEPVLLTKSCKVIERTKIGGTILSPAIGMFTEKGIHYDALVVTTDGYLMQNDIEPFSKLKVPVIWLISPTGRIMPEMNNGRMRAIKLKI